MTDPDMQAELERLRELDRRRTPGEWTQWVEHSEVFAGAVKKNTPYSFSPSDLKICECNSDDMEALPSEDEAIEYAHDNASFIASAPAMMSLLERMWTRIGELEKEREALRTKGTCPKHGCLLTHTVTDDVFCGVCRTEDLRSQVDELQRDPYKGQWKRLAMQAEAETNDLRKQVEAQALEIVRLQKRIGELEKECEWRPIESAPKDGEFADLWCIEESEDDSPRQIRITDCHFEGDEWWTDDGSGTPVELSVLGWFPTHYKPLPNPPEQKP